MEILFVEALANVARENKKIGMDSGADGSEEPLQHLYKKEKLYNNNHKSI